MGKRNIIRAVIFLTICLGMFVYLNEAFSIADSDENSRIINSFYAEKTDSLDGVYIGSSAANRFWNGTLAYNQHGFCIFTLATASQPAVLYQSLIEEVEKSQNPKLYIIELRDITKSVDGVSESGIRRVTDNMKYSLNWVKAINTAVGFVEQGDNDVDTDKIDYYLRLLKYHDRWNSKNLTINDLTLQKSMDKTKGFMLGTRFVLQEAQRAPVYVSEAEPLEKEMETVLDNLLTYCDTLDAEVMFVLSPYCGQDLTKAGRMRMAAKVVADRGYTVLNFNEDSKLTNAVGLDWETDYYDRMHVNVLGAEKYTTYLADYISEHYKLKDHRGDKEYQSWDDAYAYYVDRTDDVIKSLKQSTKEPQ